MAEDECRRAVSRLSAWADGALPPAEQARLDRHFDRCPPCRAAAAQERGGRELLRARADRLREARLPPGLQSRCQALARGRAAGGVLRGRLVPVALAAGVALFALAALLSFATSRSATLLAAQFAADHLKCAHLIGAPDGGDPEGIQALAQHRYGWEGPVPPSSGDGRVELLGVRRCLYADGVVPHAMYRAGGRDMSLYRLNGVSRTPADVVTLGYRSRIWSSGGATFVLVMPDGDPELAAAAAYVMQHTR